MNVVSCARYGVCNLFFSSVQINVSSKKVVFFLNITCTTIFMFFKDFLKLSLGIKINKLFEKGKKKTPLEVDTYCFELLACPMVINFF